MLTWQEEGVYLAIVAAPIFAQLCSTMPLNENQTITDVEEEALKRAFSLVLASALFMSEKRLLGYTL